MVCESPGQVARESDDWNFAQTFRPLPPIPWLSPVELARAGVKAAVSKAFGDYVDRRDFLGLLDGDAGDDVIDLAQAPQPFWFDYVSDLGDGFRATYSVAERLARRCLSLGDGSDVAHFGVADGLEVGHPIPELPAGQLLVMGGDQVYPAPVRTVEREAYWDRTVGPYELACVEAGRAEQVGHLRGTRSLAAIPGNHDWYDGLVSFLGQFCVRRAIGVWQTEQRRSYFAARLPHDWWIWGIDIAFEGPMDTPQLDYFRSVAKKMGPTQSVILCTAKPAWLEATDGESNRYQLLQYFLRQIDAARAAVEPDPLPPLDIPVMLSGDKHFYARHVHRESPDGPITSAKVVAGGGGASLSTTQGVPRKLSIAERSGAAQSDYGEDVVWPTQEQSRGRIAASAFVRIPRTASFCAFLAVLYLGLAYVVRQAVQADKGYVRLAGMVQKLGPAYFRIWLDLAVAAVQDTLFWAIVVGMVLGLFALASKGGVPGLGLRLVVAVIHGTFHALALFSVMAAAVYLGQHFPIAGSIGALTASATILILTWAAARHQSDGALTAVLAIVWLIALGAFVVVAIWGHDIWHSDDARALIAYLYVLGVGSYIVATFVFIAYLFVVQLWGWNTTELGAGLLHGGWKHFLRVRVDEDSLTFYALGIRKVPRRWVDWSASPNGRPSPQAKGSVGTLEVFDTIAVARPPRSFAPPES